MNGVRWFLFLVPVALMAQTEAPPLTMHAETRVVQIDVVVVDSHGNPVTGLTKADFTITDERKPRGIDIFSSTTGEEKATELPAPRQTLPPHVFSNRNAGPPAVSGHSTVIILDQVNAFFEDAGYARQQVMNLMQKLKPDERIAIYVIARKLGLLVIQDYTTDHELALNSLRKYIPRGLAPRPGFPEPWPVNVQDLNGAAAKPPNSNNPPKPSPRESEFVWRENSEQARLSLQALAEHLAHVPGRKSIFWVTQGFPARLMREMGAPAWDKTITALNEANVAVNTVDSRGLFIGSNPNGPTISAMQQIAETTGGKAFFGRNDMDAAMASGIEASRTNYTLGFYLGDDERDNKFHALRVKVNRPGLQLFYRQGYYAGNTDLPMPANDKAETEAALLNQVDSNAVGITARVIATPGTPRGTVDIRLVLDPATLSLSEKGAGKVEETFLERNASGDTLSKVSDTKEFEITSANRADFEGKGIGWTFSMPLAPGATKIAILVRDSKTGRVGSLSVPLK